MVAIAAIVTTTMFAGCINEEMPATTPTPTLPHRPTPTPTHTGHLFAVAGVRGVVS